MNTECRTYKIFYKKLGVRAILLLLIDLIALLRSGQR